jgi:hypothetical protein
MKVLRRRRFSSETVSVAEGDTMFCNGYEVTVSVPVEADADASPFSRRANRKQSSQSSQSSIGETHEKDRSHHQTIQARRREGQGA